MKARSRIFLKLILALAFVYHGVFNLSEEGRVFWSEGAQLVYPSYLRWPVGIGEIAAAVLLFWSVTERVAIVGLGLIMVGAVINNFPMGFSYKNLGIEVPLTYLVILWVLFDESPSQQDGMSS
jgi:uncharacterized membrane protein YphA (DoxX/SURF4 family)